MNSHQLKIYLSVYHSLAGTDKSGCRFVSANEVDTLKTLLINQSAGEFFFLSGLFVIQNKSPNQMLGTPTVGLQKGTFKVSLIFLGLKVHNIEILQIMDLIGMLHLKSDVRVCVPTL